VAKRGNVIVRGQNGFEGCTHELNDDESVRKFYLGL